ncbi:MAG: DNA polymerase III subunit beta [Bacteroidales bacterium]|nr:DNA polymerase III subunit beta [Bacteroidales bacterium]MBN2758735.1 DNA polymerase III subunit beta [Bacteroidales bacterium]
MKFVISSTELLGHLSSVSKVISGKHTLPILDNFLFKLEGNELTITGTDLETTMITKIELDNAEGEGTLALEARRLTNMLKEFPEQPLTFDANMDNLNVDILTENGKFSIVGQQGDDFPQLPEIKEEESKSIKLTASILSLGISKTIFATADDELRPVMNGIFVEISPENITFVASDSHKLVRYRRTDINTDINVKFILPKKPASLLKAILPSDNTEIEIHTDKNNAFFSINGYQLISRLVEGEYPNYSTVIPNDSPNKIIVDRVSIYNTIKRVAVFSNQASNLIKLKLSTNEMVISAQDIDFSISAYEKIKCQYDGDELEIGFKSVFLNEILSNLGSTDVVFELLDAVRAGLILPVDKNNDSEDELMLLMPMTIN